MQDATEDLIHNADREIAQRTSLLTNHLHQWLSVHAQGQCHLLFDPQLRPLEHGTPLGQALSSVQPLAVRYGVRMPPQSVPTDKCPWLTPLYTHQAAASQTVTESLRESLTELAPERVQRGLGRRIGGWLVSSAPTEAIANHLAEAMVQTTPNGQRMWLRIHDPAVLWPLFGLLTTEQRASVLGPVRTWWLLDPAGHPVQLDHPQPQALHEPPKSLRLTAEQWADVMRLNSFNVAINEWVSGQDAKPAPALVAQNASVALLALRRAGASGLNDTEDLTRFALHAMTMHPEFDRHPLVQAVLGRCNAGLGNDAEHYSAASEDLSDADWSRIRTELLAHG